MFSSSTGVSIDTRKISKDQMFFSLRGNNFDGNIFALEAIKNGAKFAVVDDKRLQDKDNRIIYVNDSLKALQDLSNYHRSLFDTKVIGITGSNGKTTTKNLIYSILSQTYNVIKTKGNLNNHIGVPLSLLDINENVDIAVIEMGANHIGEIKALCEIAMPDFGLITNYGYAHLEGFGGFEGVIKGKSEMFEYLTQNYGHIILNNDDKIQIKNCKGDLAVTFGEKEGSEFLFKYKKEQKFLSFENNGDKYSCEIYGDYNFTNIAASITIGKFLDISSTDIQKGLISFKNDSNRSEILDYGSNKIYLDAYNANPTSMKAAILNFENNITENKILILGDMYELGEFSNNEHQNIIDFIEDKDFMKVYLVGDIFYNCKTKSKYFERFKSTEEMLKSVILQDFNSTNILIKGSRGLGLENLITS
ncbi:UDP-N-acetylmuramoyl-tripeptide--D-alanyl-D-alanine ligase [Flavobacteriaceae bacterium]|nr:UDP-N-acetylmuramoyl-tripeptide--D-alanyl-D-alanine ligase [Flavobacteriaceae bacterium]